MVVCSTLIIILVLRPGNDLLPPSPMIRLTNIIADSSTAGLLLSLSRSVARNNLMKEVRGEISELFCDVLCTEVVHSHKHT